MANSNDDLVFEPRGLEDLKLQDNRGDKDTKVKSGGKASRGGAAAGGAQSRDIGISKALSKILRHSAEQEGLKLDKEGYARVDELLAWKRLKSLKTTFEDIQRATIDNAKQRFSMKPNPAIDPLPESTSVDPSHWLIRANQGHSIALESAALLTPITLAADNVPDAVVHGTYYAFYAPIVATGGLKPMGRNHIHFSTGLPEDAAAGVISGMRSDAEILFYIDVRKSLEDDAAQWWLSDNGVVLTEGGQGGLVPTKYWKKVEGRRQDVGILWEDGLEVAELPQSVRGRKAPSGKGPKGKVREHADGARGGRGGGKSSRGRNKELDILGGEESLGAEGP